MWGPSRREAGLSVSFEPHETGVRGSPEGRLSPFSTLPRRWWGWPISAQGRWSGQGIRIAAGVCTRHGRLVRRNPSRSGSPAGTGARLRRAGAGWRASRDTRRARAPEGALRRPSPKDVSSGRSGPRRNSRGQARRARDGRRQRAPVREPEHLRQQAQPVEEAAAGSGPVPARPPQVADAVQERVQREGEQVQRGEQVRQAVLAMSEVVREVTPARSSSEGWRQRTAESEGRGKRKRSTPWASRNIVARSGTDGSGWGASRSGSE